MARVRLSVDIEPELKLAALRGVTISDIVVQAVRGILAAEGTEELIHKPSDLAGTLRQYADAKKRSREI